MNARGMSLIELLAALGIGSFLIVGAITVYTRSSAAYAANETMARLQENARYALNTLEPDVQLAGFWGLTSDARRIRGAIGNSPLALSAGAARCGPAFPLNLRQPVEGTNNTYSLPCAATGGAMSGSDVLIVRHVEPDAASASSQRLQIYTTREGVTDRIFLANSAPGPITTDPLLGASAEVHDLSAHAYYISRDSTGRSGFPSLRRKSLEGGPATGPNVGDEEVMSGVEDLQVQFGIDPGVDSNADGTPDDADGDGRPDRYTGHISMYVNPADPLLINAVVIAARIWIRIRSESPERGPPDNRTYDYADVSFTPAGDAAAYRRLVVSRTIYLRNTAELLP